MCYQKKENSMKRKVLLTCLIIPVLLIGFSGSVPAQGLTIDIDGGVSQPVGTEMTHWITGFDFGTNIFLWPVDRIGIGLRVGYDRWTPDKAKFTDEVGPLLNSDVTGSTSIVEIIPSLRITTGYRSSGINFFGQVGTGIYAIRAESNVTGLVSGALSTMKIDNGEWIGRWGFQIGPGISLGSARSLTFDIFPFYNVVFNGNHVFQYFIVNAGISFKV
jgi:hypothetical protein